MGNYSLLDCFEPDAIVHMIRRQSKTDADYWEQKHINVMRTACQYVKDVYPKRYWQVEEAHGKFNKMEGTF